MERRVLGVLGAAAVLAVCIPASAGAASPGLNGKIAYHNVTEVGDSLFMTQGVFVP